MKIGVKSEPWQGDRLILHRCQIINEDGVMTPSAECTYRAVDQVLDVVQLGAAPRMSALLGRADRQHVREGRPILDGQERKVRGCGPPSLGLGLPI